jgi:predicted alpha/beta superfamily hydrolase
MTLDWRDYTENRPPGTHTVTGTLRVLAKVYSPQLDNRRDILVYLPDGHAAGRRYPVVYMHDGQNLFDEAASFAGEWHADEVMQALEQAGTAAIIVGIPNIGSERIHEYSPFIDRRLSRGRGALYARFMAETVKPLVDASFHTLPGREHTGIMGSSMGGLISLYAFFAQSHVFGFAGAMSPALWFAQRATLDWVRTRPFAPGRIYLDMGTAEAMGPRRPAMLRWLGEPPSARFVRDARAMRDLLREKGYHEGRDLLYVEDEGAPHHESAWARRLPDALRFLLRGTAAE